MSAYIFVASMDVDSERELLFNKVYDYEHIPNLLSVPGVRSVRRMKVQNFSMSIGGEIRLVAAPKSPLYHALYELDSPDVLVSPPWATAIEAGRWPREIRPFTRNRQHLLMRQITPAT